MALADMDFYASCFGGEYDERVIMPLLERAEADIRCVCSDRAEGVFEADASVSDKIIFAVKRAVCLQAEFLAERDGKQILEGDASGEDGAASELVSAAASEGGVSSVKLGDFSVIFGSSEASGNGCSASDDGFARGNVCGEALLILDKQGLLYRGGVIV